MKLLTTHQLSCLHDLIPVLFPRIAVSLAVLDPRLLVFFDLRHSPILKLKLLTARFDIQQPIFGYNFLNHSMNVIHICRPMLHILTAMPDYHFITPSLFHSQFKPTFPQIISTTVFQSQTTHQTDLQTFRLLNSCSLYCSFSFFPLADVVVGNL